eukprot:TRINITY_DN2752_c1_g1_i1.p1 TRINITY_DN2752_c1_g1~~TRINITY_DN2752_c1_g1_i1.p1  ORF type:complete len:91 (-),score=32.25 TRINITY_DN2752_c1_g1_i1:70-342(-)
MNFRSAEQNKDEFRKYLTNGGVIDAITKTLVELYECDSKPEKPIDFVAERLTSHTEVSINELKEENDLLRQRVEQLTKENHSLKQRLGEA